MTELMQWVEMRSWRDPDNGCLVWKMGGAHGNKQPQGRYLGRIILVRRAVYEERTGKKLSLAQTVKCTCEREGCVEPTHLVAKRNRGREGQKATIAQRRNISEGVRRSAMAKLTEEAVADIRTQQEPRTVYAERYSIAKEYVTDIQGFRVWRDYSNPFISLAQWSPL